MFNLHNLFWHQLPTENYPENLTHMGVRDESLYESSLPNAIWKHQKTYDPTL